MSEENTLMTRQDALKQLRQVRKEFTEYYSELIKTYGTDEVRCDLMTRRCYSDDAMYRTLEDVGLIRVDSFLDLVYHPFTQSFETHTLWGLTDANGVPHLSGRYIVPIRDICGNVTALVGWYPDSRKYITTPTFGFARDAQFFNVECYQKYKDKGCVFLTEGIFDTLSLRSQDVFALGNMGLPLSGVKAKQLQRFGKVYAITDADKAGQSVLPHKNGRNKWNINNATFVQIALPDVVFGDVRMKIKDIDDAVKFYDIRKDLQVLTTKQGYMTRLKED